MPYNYKHIFLSVISGICLAVSFILPYTLPCVIIGLVILINVTEIFLRKKQRFNYIMPHIFVAFLLFNGLASFWIIELSFTAWLLLTAINTSLMLGVWRIIYFFRQKGTKINILLSYLLPWISFEFLTYHIFLQWTWLNLGNLFASVPELVQWYEYTGILGGSVWILSFSVVIYFLFRDLHQNTVFSHNRNYKSLLSTKTFVLAGMLLFLFVFPQKEYSTHEKEVNLSIIQPNINPYLEKFDSSFSNTQDSIIIAQLNEACRKNTDIIIAPETAITNKISIEAPYSNSIIDSIQALCDSSKSTIVIGCYSYSGNSSEFQKQTDSLHNSIAFFSPNSEIQFYHKNNLVYGIEKLPFESLVFLSNLFFESDTLINMHPKNSPLQLCAKNGINISPIICYESALGAYTATRASNTDIITIATNDGWWSYRAAYQQHFDLSRLRAIETRSFIARSGNTGISGTINPNGEVTKNTEWNKRDILSANISPTHQLTFYEKYGDWIGKLALLITLILFIRINITFHIR